MGAFGSSAFQNNAFQVDASTTVDSSKVGSDIHVRGDRIHGQIAVTFGFATSITASVDDEALARVLLE